MELIWALMKMIQYVVLGPVWWLASHLAAVFYPFEGDSNHDLLAFLFSSIIIGLLIYISILLLR